MAKPAIPPSPTLGIPPSRSRSPAVRPKPRPVFRRGSAALALILLGGALLFLSVAALPVCVLISAGMIPAAVAYIVDQSPRRTLTLTVGPLNLAGTAPFCVQLWYGVDTMPALAHELADPWVWLVMYGAAALGWLLHLGMPQIVQLLLERSIDLRKARLVQLQSKLRIEWGDEVDPAARPDRGSSVPGAAPNMR